MLRHSNISKVLTISTMSLVGVCCFAVSAAPQSDKPVRKIAVVVQCEPAVDQAKERIFANPGLKSWKEYSKVEEVPALGRDNGEQMFAVNSNASGKRSVRLVEYGEDSSTVETLCYDKEGALRSLKYEIRTAWGWGYSEDCLLGPKGGIVRRTQWFFDTASGQTILRPRQADDVPGFLQAKIYRSFDQLPFYALLNQQTRVDAAQK